MIEPISAATWRAAVAFSSGTLEMMARAYLGLGGVPVVELDGDVVVGVRLSSPATSGSPRGDAIVPSDQTVKPRPLDAVASDFVDRGHD